MELTQGEESLSDQIKKADFKDETDFLSARLSDEDRQLLTDKEKSLIKEKTELDARKKDKAVSLASEREKRLTDQPAEVLVENISKCDSKFWFFHFTTICHTSFKQIVYTIPTS